LPAKQNAEAAAAKKKAGKAAAKQQVEAEVAAKQQGAYSRRRWMVTRPP